MTQAVKLLMDEAFEAAKEYYYRAASLEEASQKFDVAKAKLAELGFKLKLQQVKRNFWLEATRAGETDPLVKELAFCWACSHAASRLIGDRYLCEGCADSALKGKATNV